MLDWELTQEEQIPKNQAEAENLRSHWLGNLPRLDECK
jgi:hypothetical protein